MQARLYFVFRRGWWVCAIKTSSSSAHGMMGSSTLAGDAQRTSSRSSFFAFVLIRIEAVGQFINKSSYVSFLLPFQWFCSVGDSSLNRILAGIKIHLNLKACIMSFVLA
jgi:hypothetical protein